MLSLLFSVLEVPRLVCRAEAELPPDLRNKFATLRQLADD